MLQTLNRFYAWLKEPVAVKQIQALKKWRGSRGEIKNLKVIEKPIEEERKKEPEIEIVRTDNSPEIREEEGGDPELAEVRKYLPLFKEVIDLWKGRSSINARVRVLSNPDDPLTMTILEPNEERFVEHANLLYAWFNEFEPLKQYADLLVKVKISRKGKGREQVLEALKALVQEDFAKSGGSIKKSIRETLKIGTSKSEDSEDGVAP